MSQPLLADLLELSVPERAALAQAIWDSIVELPDAVPLTDSERQELDRRFAAYLEDPDRGVSWQELKARLRSTG